MPDPNDVSTLISEIQKLEERVNHFNTATWVLGGLTALVGVIAAFVAFFNVYYNGQLKTKNDRLTTIKEQMSLDRQRLSDEKIAFSNAQAKIALENAALSNEKAQTAVATAEESKAEQAKLAIESRKGQTELANAQRKQAEAELALRQKVDEIKEKQAPRILTVQQKQIMLPILSKAANGKTIYYLGATDDEAYKYINQILDVLKTAGWRVDEEDMYATNITGEGTSGIRIMVKDINNPPAHAVALAEAFHSAGIEFTIQLVKNIETSSPSAGMISPNSIVLFIGIKSKL
jgi:hypothetical protein